MARQVFFSFHYDRDIWRVNQVRKSNAFKRGDDEAVYFDHSLWEETKKSGDAALRKLIDDGMKGSSVTAVLIGAQTAGRRWVKYEIQKSEERGMGLLGIYIHRLPDQLEKTDVKGSNPLKSKYATYDWVLEDGYNHFGAWVEKAAKAAGR